MKYLEEKGLLDKKDEAKKLIDEVGSDEAERLMLRAAEFSANPWGFAFLHRLKRSKR